jgi:SAM-dependent methyltransferase
MMLHLLPGLIQKFINLNFKIINALWRLNAKLDATHEAFWLSVLSVHQHQEIIVRRYRKAKHYLDDENITSGLYDWEWYIIDNYLHEGEFVVLVGAGCGREVYCMLQRGLRVSAFECTPQMVEYAKAFFAKENIEVSFEQLPANTVPDKTCDTFWLGWGVYTHMMGAANRIEFLKSVAEKLNPQGKIVISFWFENRNPERVDYIEKVNRKINKRIIEKGESFRSIFWGKYYSESQIRQEAAAAGLNVLYFGSEDYGHAVLCRK